MNLFLDAFRRFSRFDADAFLRDIGPGMPEHFLLSTLRLEPALRPHTHDVEHIVGILGDPRTKTRLWRNPEIYAEIALLAEAARHGRDTTFHLEHLRVHCGIVSIRAARVRNGPYRLAHLDGTVFLAEDGALRDVSTDVVTARAPYTGVTLLPRGGLFADLVPDTLYPAQADPFNRADLERRVSAAFDRLAAYSADLFAEFARAITTVVFTPDLHDEARWSYNLRLSYVGGIFVNPFATGVQGLVEGFIHEYLHQRLWQWWAYDSPEGLPAEDATVLSPVTGRRKPARVMVHALLIYIAVHEYYLTQRDSDEAPWVAARLSLLRGAIPELRRRLAHCVPAETTTASLLDFAVERFAERAGVEVNA